MNIQNIFGFGKYKGLKVIDIYRGTLNIDRQLLKDYVQYLLNTNIRFHFERNFGSDAFQWIDKFEVNDFEIKTFEFRETGINPDDVPYGEYFEIALDIESDIELCLSIGNQMIGYEMGGFCSLAEFSKNYDRRILVGADPGYLSWCIKKLNNFFIPIDEMEKLEKLKISLFNGIHVLQKEGGTYEYFPNMQIKKYCFTEEIKQLNLRKIEKHVLEVDEKPNNVNDNGPGAYGYTSWEEMSFYEAYEGDSDAWAHDNQ